MIIKKSPNADSRTSVGEVTKDELRQSSLSHISDVEQGVHFIARLMEDTAESHDWTKIDFLDEFYEDFCGKEEDFRRDDGWFKAIHIIYEQHHLNDRVPLDVTLIDVIEMVVDCTMAGLARSGKVTNITIPPEVLQKAIDNTVRLLINNTEVV